MKLALIANGLVLQEPSEADAALVGADGKPLFDIRDVSSVKGIAPGWLANEDGSYSAPPVVTPATPTITYKSDLYRRATDAEAEAMETALASAPVRERRLFESVQYLDHDAPEFTTLQEHLVEMFGAKRAGELLAAS